MPCMGPSEDSKDVDKAYAEVMALLKRKHGIQKFPAETSWPRWDKEREERNKKFKEALRLLFQLEAWESF